MNETTHDSGGQSRHYADSEGPDHAGPGLVSEGLGPLDLLLAHDVADERPDTEDGHHYTGPGLASEDPFGLVTAPVRAGFGAAAAFKAGETLGRVLLGAIRDWAIDHVVSWAVDKIGEAVSITVHEEDSGSRTQPAAEDPSVHDGGSPPMGVTPAEVAAAIGYPAGSATAGQTSTPADANASYADGTAGHVDAPQPGNDTNASSTPADANTSLPDGTAGHVDAPQPGNDTSASSTPADANASLPDGTAGHIDASHTDSATSHLDMSTVDVSGADGGGDGY